MSPARPASATPGAGRLPGDGPAGGGAAPAGAARTSLTLFAALLAGLLAAAWSWRDRANLAALQLPDTDDAVRLQQIRDWLAGQPFADLVQHRFADGLAMHWSRLADLVPGAVVAGLAPLVGRHAAEVAAVIVWPALLFGLALALLARIAAVMRAPAGVAIVVGALAFPATALFLPGRIDHHGLQLVLLLGLVAALLAPRGAASGAGIALAMTLGLVVGLETAPLLLLGGVLPVLGWIAGRGGAARQLAALAAVLLVTLGLAEWIFAPAQFGYPACDGFTRPVWRAALAGGASLAVLAGLGRFVGARRYRLGLAVAVGSLAAVFALWTAPACLAPYGGVAPALAVRWLARVGEAQPLFAAPLATVVGQCGLMLAGLAAVAVALWRTRDPGWAILALFQLVAAGLAVWQLRGANAGALLGVPALAWLIGQARMRGTGALVTAWLAAAGIIYPLAAGTLPASPDAEPPACNDPATLAALDRLPPGLVAGPIDLGAWGLAATRHRFLAAPYHRNGAGNAAAFAILDGPAQAAAPLLARWRVDYIATCGAPPAWLRAARAILRHGDLSVYRIAGLPEPARAP